MSLRVVVWSTGTVGRHAIAGIDRHPDLELVGVWVSNPDKVGRDAGDLAGLGRDLGVLATDDRDALLALQSMEDPTERRSVPEGLWVKCPSCETVL